MPSMYYSLGSSCTACHLQDTNPDTSSMRFEPLWASTCHLDAFLLLRITMENDNYHDSETALNSFESSQNYVLSLRPPWSNSGSTGRRRRLFEILLLLHLLLRSPKTKIKRENCKGILRFDFSGLFLVHMLWQWRLPT